MSEVRLIDGNALKKELDYWVVVLNKPQYYKRDEALYLIDNAPTIDPSKHGKWELNYVPAHDPHDRLSYKCSECGRVEYCKEPYCNCGARMDRSRDCCC